MSSSPSDHTPSPVCLSGEPGPSRIPLFPNIPPLTESVPAETGLTADMRRLRLDNSGILYPPTRSANFPVSLCQRMLARLRSSWLRRQPAAASTSYQCQLPCLRLYDTDPLKRGLSKALRISAGCISRDCAVKGQDARSPCV